MPVAHDMPFGAQVEPGNVRFRLWAPAQDEVTLLLQTAGHEHALPMVRAGGWFECHSEAAQPGDRYLYRLQDGRRVPDPASRFQPDDVRGASEVVDPYAYVWQQADWAGRLWREAVIYEAHVGAFSARGDYDGMRLKLGHLARLGVTALQLMPLADFEGRRNWGYDGALLFAPDASYGRPEALKHLVDSAHAHGIMVLLDVVYNHFGPSGNDPSIYAPQFFTDRHHTPWGTAINFGCGEVRRFYIENALYWLQEYRFDGLRVDAADHILDDSPQHILSELAATVRKRITDRHVHLVLENDANTAHYLTRADAHAPPASHYTAQWNEDWHHAAHVLATGEQGGYYADYARDPVAAFARALAQGFFQQGDYSAYRGHDRGEPSAQLPPLAFVSFLQNHDQIGNRAFGERLDALADAQPVTALTAILLLSPEVPLLFMGQEWAATQPFFYFCDYDGALADAVREGRRREYGPLAGMDDAVARGRIPDPNAPSTFATSVLDWGMADSAASQQRMALVRKLLHIRQRAIVPRLTDDAGGGTHEVRGRALHVHWPLADGHALHLAANLSDHSAHDLHWTLPGQRLYAQPRELPQQPLTRMPPWSVLWSLA